MLYCESSECSPWLLNLRVEFRAHLEQNIPAVSSWIFDFIVIGQKHVNWQWKLATYLEQGRIHRTEVHTKTFHKIVKFKWKQWW